jgi:hypothetical protein
MTKSLVYKFVNLRNQLGFLAPELGGALEVVIMNVIVE